jgi:translocation and assembly module TamA
MATGAKPLGSNAKTTSAAIAGYLAFAAALAALAGPVEAREPYRSPFAETVTGKPTVEETTESVPYQVEFVGVEDSGLRDILEAASRLIELQDRPPPTLARLTLRAEEDLKRLESVLRSEGYYDATLQSDIQSDATPTKVVIHIDTGPQYRLADYQVVYEGASPPPEALRPDLKELGLEIGMPAKGPVIAAAGQSWRVRMTQRGYPFARVIDRKAVITPETKSMSVTLRVDAGEPAKFGEVTISGLERLETDHVRRLLPWRRGETYDSRKLENARRSLSQTRIFASVTVKPGEKLDEHGELPITIDLSEGPPRTIGFGVSYSTDVGFGGNVFWEHRNLFGEGEQLRLDLEASEIEQSLSANLRKPTYPGLRQTLVFNFSLSNENTEAYDEQAATALVGIESGYLENWQLSGGVSPEYSYVKDMGEHEEYFLLGFPLTATRDARDDRLNPTSGTRLELALTPYQGLNRDDPSWVTETTGGSAYVAVDEDKRFVLAGRTKVGFLTGASNDSVPASKRFYAGGGGSIRGYKFQTVGDIDANGDPVGGRSLLEVSTELRVRVTDQIGVVPFVDGGTVYRSSYPDFSNTFRWAAGLGLRYFTGIGPVRLDVAFPINRRDTDDVYQFYISFGQAF